MTFNNNVIIGGNLTVNGSLTYLNSTNTNITDALITLNKGGSAASAGGSGIEFEENALITGYFKVAADRNGFEMLAPNVAFKNDLDLSNLSADHVQKFADTDGTFVMRPDGTPGVANQVAFWQDANNLVSDADFVFNPGTNRLTVLNLTVTNAPTVSAFGAGVVHSSAAGLLSSSPVVLTSEVSGVLPIANGGTNSGTALNNNRLMYSSGGAIVEYAALLPNKVYFGAATTGLPAQATNLHWDITNGRLGIGNAAPTRTLDITGDVLVTGSFKVDNAGKANFEIRQGQVSTTDATVTTAETVAIPTDSEVVIEAKILGRRSSGAGSNGDAAAYTRTARFKNVGGTVTRVATPQTDYTTEDVNSWDGTISASGSNAIITVKGAASTNVDWAVSSFIQILQ
jgi:hypothetical protein